MAIIPFVQTSGFKLLATAHLEKSDYSVVLYLLNCVASGLNEILTTEAELASLIGFETDEIIDSLERLRSRKFIKIKVGDKHSLHHHPQEHTSLSIQMEFDTTNWVISHDEDGRHNVDATIYPFRRSTGAELRVLDGEDSRNAARGRSKTWERVLKAFCTNRSLDDNEVEAARKDAQLLTEAHSVDQVLLVLRHFGVRIPNLNLLASSWQHYLDIFLEETQHVDLIDMRQKHIEMDQSIRSRALDLLETDSDLTEEEKQVLEILSKHRNPRRQLFWAYQLRSRYPHLAPFFAENAEVMIPVTTGGTIVPKR